MIKHVKIIVKGKVQGVSFRVATKAVADQLGVKGIIKNEETGEVYIEAEGDPVSLSLFMDWCHEGPEQAMVEALESMEADLKNYRNFEIIKRSKS
jgi:acylphosphatase